MIRTQFIEEQLRHGRLDAKTLDNMFRRRIEEGANCSPFVSQAILATVKEVFSLAPEEANSQLALGQIKLLVVSAEEPAGKPLEQCQKLTVLLTLDAGQEDYQVRLAHGVEGLRRARILRVTAEARDQGGLLSYEDLAFRLFNCGVRTIVRDVQALRRRGLEVPARGQQQDIGPGQTHRVQAVRLYLQGLEANEIARRLYHTLGSIENYVTTFARVAFLVTKGYGDDEIAFVIRRSSPLVAAYRKLLGEFQAKPSARRRLQEILARVETTTKPAAKKGGALTMVKRSSPCYRPYDASERKTFKSALCHLLQTEFPGIFGPTITRLFADKIDELYDRFHPPVSRFKVGQVLWAAVAVDDPPRRNKRIEDTATRAGHPRLGHGPRHQRDRGHRTAGANPPQQDRSSLSSGLRAKGGAQPCRRLALASRSYEHSISRHCEARTRDRRDRPTPGHHS